MGRRSRKSTSRPFQRRLRVEHLEDRRLLAVLTVDSLQDNTTSDGLITLREAIIGANNDAIADAVEGTQAGSGADTINFDASLSGQTITLGGAELEITETLTIDATALTNNVTIDANLLSRIFNNTAANGGFSLAGMTLTGGRTTGDNANSSDTTFSGGAIRSVSTGSLIIDQSTVIENSTTGSRARGGGIFSLRDFTLTNSIVSGNSTAGLFADGGGIFSEDYSTLTNSTVSGNSTAGDFADGGGIVSSGFLMLTNSTVSGNSAVGIDAGGGGIFSSSPSSSVTLTGSTVSGNGTAGGNSFGGGILSSGTLTLTSSTISGNSTTGYNSNGGGIRSLGNVTLTNSTVTDNHAYYFDATGGGVWNSNDTITITNSILAGNTAGGGSPDIRPGTGTLSINFSLIGDNAGTNLVESQTPDANGNLIGSAAGSGVIDPLLGPLTNNGGPTETHALLTGSPAINAGDPAAIAGVGDTPLFDQRGNGFDRVSDGRIDIGAFEVQSAVLISADFDTDGDIDGADFLAWQRGFGTQAPNATPADGDADGDQDVDAADLGVWASQFGQPAPLAATVDSSPSLVSREVAFSSSEFAGIADIVQLRQQTIQAAQLVDRVFESESNDALFDSTRWAPTPASSRFVDNTHGLPMPSTSKTLESAEQESSDFAQALDVVLGEEFTELYSSI